MKKFYPYQVRGARFFLDKGRGVLADDPGLGKTAQAIGATNPIYHSRILVICPKQVKYVWQEQVLEWSGEDVVIIAGKSSAEQLKQWKEADQYAPWRVIHYEFFREYWEEIIKWKPQIIIMDESHKIKNRAAKISKAISKASTRLSGVSVYQLTGTPIWNKPNDLWHQLYIASNKKLPAYWQWVNQWLIVTQVSFGNRNYPVTKIGKPKDPEAFKEHVSQWLLRRTRADVRGEVPPVIHKVVPLEMDADQKKAYATMYAQCYAKIGEKEISATSVIAQIIRLKQISISKFMADKDSKSIEGCKLEWLLDFLDEMEDRQVLIFSQFAQVVLRLAESLNHHGYNNIAIVGDTPDSQRDFRRKLFTDKKVPILLMTLGTGGVGIDGLQYVCSDVVFMDLDWTPAVNQQAVARLDRVGQTEPVVAHIPMTKGTIEWWIYERLQNKQAIAEDSIPVEDLRAALIQELRP